MSFLPRAVDGKKRVLKPRPGRSVAMDRQDEWRDWESCACDEAQTAPSDWATDSQPRTDGATFDARPVGQHGRIMVIGFHVIRV
jgi:hypothetical protein